MWGCVHESSPVLSQSMSCCSDRARFSPDTRAFTHSTAAVVAKDQQHPHGLLFTCTRAPVWGS